MPLSGYEASPGVNVELCSQCRGLFLDRSEIRELVDIFRGKIVDVGPHEVMVEISGRENKVQAFIERMRPYGITELVRTGRIAMIRSGNDVDAAIDSETRAAS